MKCPMAVVLNEQPTAVVYIQMRATHIFNSSDELRIDSSDEAHTWT